VVAVRDPTGTGATTTVRLAADVGVAAVREVLADLPAGDTVVIAGRTRFTSSARQRDPALATPFVALSRLRGPAREVVLDDTEGVTVNVDDRAQAAPFARSAVAALAPRGRWPASIDGLRVRLSRSPSTDDPLIVTMDDRAGERSSVRDTLDVGVALGDRLGRIGVAGKRIELRVRIREVANAGPTWRSAAGRLGAAAEDVSLYLDPVDADGDPTLTGPVLSGAADESPTPALRLLGSLDAVADRPFVSVPATFARATVPRLADGGRVATLARRAGVRRLQLRQADADGAWLDGTTMSGPDDLPELRDAPATVLRLLRSTPRLARAGLSMQWTEANFGTARARFSRPDWLEEDTDLLKEPATLRRLATAIRAATWPGDARFALALGPGSCGGEADEQTQAGVTVTSTAGGRASEVDAAAGSGCRMNAGVRAVRRAWDATAD
jgi:hypothetical protein